MSTALTPAAAAPAPTGPSLTDPALTDPVPADSVLTSPAPTGVGAALGGVGPRRVLLAAPRGYCAGVDRAVVAVEKVLEQHGAPVYVRKQIVHNSYVVARLEERGAVFVDEISEVPTGSVVVFSAHGVSPAVRDQARERDLLTVDATCPLVTKVHAEARRFAADGYEILLVGHEGHEEVEGTAGEAPAVTHVVDRPDSVAQVEVRDPSRVVWLSQTTLSVDETMTSVQGLRARFPLLADPPSDDICYATQNRQVAVKEIAPQADLVLVVGSANSSNSVRLVEVALDAGATAAHRVDRADELDEGWLAGVSTVGVTSGASVPEILVDEVLAWLAQRGFGDVEEVRTATETLTFALPRELRTKLREHRAAGSDVSGSGASVSGHAVHAAAPAARAAATGHADPGVGAGPRTV